MTDRPTLTAPIAETLDRVSFRTHKPNKAAWHRAAKRDGLTLVDWIERALNAQAAASLDRGRRAA